MSRTGVGSGEPRPYARLVFRKRGALRWLSHLDLVRAFERALRRSRLPLAYSQGFNPRPKLAFAYPLPLGVEGLAELCAVDLAESVSSQVIRERLGPQLPRDLGLVDARTLVRGRRSPFADLTVARYELVIGCSCDREQAALRGAAERVRFAQSLLVVRQTKNRTFEVDLRPRIHALDVATVSDETVVLSAVLGVTQESLVKPQELLQVLENLGAGGPIRPLRIIRMGLE